MAERKYPDQFVGLLPAEAARWVADGLITAEQRESILRLYPKPSVEGRDRTILVFSILGSLLVGAGVILFFAANWAALSATVKVGAILAAIAGTYWVGYHLQFNRDDYPLLGQALIFLATLLYGAGIWLIAQIFHLNAHFPTGFLMWGLGVLPLAWVVRSSPVLYLSTVMLTLWTVMEQGPFESFNYVYPLLLVGLIFPLARGLKTAIGEAAVPVGLFIWFAVNVMVHVPFAAQAQGELLFGRLILLYGVALFAGGMARLGDERAYLVPGAFGALLGSYLMTFQGTPHKDDMINSLFVGSGYLTVGILVVLAAGIGAAWLYWREDRQDRLFVLPALLVLVGAALTAHLFGSTARLILFNTLLFGGTVGLIAMGIGRRSSWLVNIGLVAFLVHVLTRYFDLFFSAMNRAAFFILGGILLLGGGWLLERNRRRWMQKLGGDRHDG